MGYYSVIGRHEALIHASTRMNLEHLWSVTEASHKRSLNTGFHFYETPGIGKTGRDRK